MTYLTAFISIGAAGKESVWQAVTVTEAFGWETIREGYFRRPHNSSRILNDTDTRVPEKLVDLSSS
jgi:hypothetical protein